MKYIVNINSVTNILGDEDFFIGTGFMGAPFSTMLDFKNQFLKYAYDKDNKPKAKVIKLTFSLNDINEKIKEDAKAQALENKEFADFGRVFSIYRNNPFKGITLYYRPQHWLDSEGNSFKFLIEDKNGKVTPNYAKKFRTVLEEIGINFD